MDAATWSSSINRFDWEEECRWGKNVRDQWFNFRRYSVRCFGVMLRNPSLTTTRHIRHGVGMQARWVLHGIQSPCATLRIIFTIHGRGPPVAFKLLHALVMIIIVLCNFFLWVRRR